LIHNHLDRHPVTTIVNHTSDVFATKMLRTTRNIQKSLSDRLTTIVLSSINKRSGYGNVIGNPSPTAPAASQSSRHASCLAASNVDERGNLRHKQENDRLLVVGSGVAGSAAALVAAETYQIPVTLLFAGNVPQDCNSRWAQGGIIYRNYDPESGDSADSLARDIHRAGAGLCDDAAVRKVAEEGPERVRQLLLKGGPFADVPFDKNPNGELSLCLGKSFYSSTCCGVQENATAFLNLHA
jgi:hypothetical protein